jgi:hypothetical protein
VSVQRPRSLGAFAVFIVCVVPLFVTTGKLVHAFVNLLSSISISIIEAWASHNLATHIHAKIVLYSYSGEPSFGGSASQDHYTIPESNYMVRLIDL